MPDKEPPKTETSIALSSDAQIRDMIYTVRGQQVMLDSDLAELYEVETKALNRAAKRNEDRFPEDFRFKLTREELDNLRCQIGTLAGQDTDSSIGRTYLPHVYTEQGAAMLSGVLRSKVAVDASVRIMRAFVEMRHFVADNAHMFEQIRSIGRRLGNLERSTDERFERVFGYMGGARGAEPEGLLRGAGIRRVRAPGVPRAEGQARDRPGRRLRGHGDAQHPRQEAAGRLRHRVDASQDQPHRT